MPETESGNAAAMARCVPVMAVLAVLLLVAGRVHAQDGEEAGADDSSEGQEAGDQGPGDEEIGAKDGGDEAHAVAHPAGLRDRDKRAALIYGPLETNVSRSSAEELLGARLAAGQPLPARIVRLDELPMPADEPLWVVGGEGDDRCGPGGRAPDWAAVIDTARGQLDALDTAEAQETLEEALDDLACADTVVEREVLGQLYMLHGLARYYEGGAEAARQDFRRAVTVNPSIEWDPNDPPEPQQVYLKAREDIYLQGRSRVEAVFSPGEVTQVVVDGLSVAANEPGGDDVHPGTHLLQYLMPDQTLISRVTTMEGGETRLLVSRAGMEGVILAGGSDPQTAPVARILLHALCADWGVEIIYVADTRVADGEEAYVYRFSREGARFERLMAAEAVDASADRVADEAPEAAPEPRSAVEGLLVLPSSVAEGSTALITAESARIDGDERLFLGEYEVANLARAGVRSTFNLPAGIPPGVYDVRILNPDGSELTYPRAFSVVGDPTAVAAADDGGAAAVDTAPAPPSEPDERLRVGLKWGMAYYRGSWATIDLEMDVRLGEGFCLDGAIGTRMVEGFYPHAYWRAGFKVRWYPKIVQGFFSINFQQFMEDLYMGPRASVGVDVVIPSMKSFYLTLESGGGVMFENARDVFGWFHVQGGTGMRF